MTLAKALAATVVLACAACQQPPDLQSSPYGTYIRPAPYWAQPVAPVQAQPAPYQAPPLATFQPVQIAPPVIGTSGTSGGQFHSPPPAPYASASLLTPTPSSPSASLIGPQRADWKPGGGF